MYIVRVQTKTVSSISPRIMNEHIYFRARECDSNLKIFRNDKNLKTSRRGDDYN